MNHGIPSNQKRALPASSLSKRELRNIKRSAQHNIRKQVKSRQHREFMADICPNGAFVSGFGPDDTYYLASNAARLHDESTAAFDARRKAHAEAGHNPNRLRRLKATGAAQVLKTRDEQRKKREYSDYIGREIPTKFAKK